MAPPRSSTDWSIQRISQYYDSLPVSCTGHHSKIDTEISDFGPVGKVGPDSCFFSPLESISTLVGPENDAWRSTHVTAERIYQYSLDNNSSLPTDQWTTDLTLNSTWKEAAGEYSMAVKEEDGVKASKAMEKLFASAATASGIKSRVTVTEDIGQLKKWRHERLVHRESGLECDSRWIDRGADVSLKRLQVEQNAAVAWTEQQVLRVMQNALDPKAQDKSIQLSGVENGIYAELLADYGVEAAARDHFQKAADSAPTVADELFYRLRGYNLLSREEQLKKQHELKDIKASIVFLLPTAELYETVESRKAQEKPKEPIFSIPPEMEGASSEELAAYPTIVIPSVTNASGEVESAGEPVMLNMPTVSGEALRKNAMAEAATNFELLAEVLAVPSEDIPSDVVVPDGRTPIIIYQPIDASEGYRKPRPPGSVKQVRMLYWLAQMQDYKNALADMIPRQGEGSSDFSDRQQVVDLKLNRLEREFQGATCKIVGDSACADASWYKPWFAEGDDIDSEKIDMSIGLNKNDPALPVNPEELQIIVDYAHMIGKRWSGEGGKLEVIVQAKDAQTAKDSLEGDFSPVFTNLDRLMAGYKNEDLLDSYSEFLLVRYPDAYRAVDLPRHGLENLKENVVLKYGDRKPVGDYLAKLQNAAPHLFVNGQLDPTVDISDTREGTLAAMSQASRYYLSNDTFQEMALPIASSLGGGALGAGLGMLVCGGPETPVGWACAKLGAVIGGALGGGGGVYASSEINLARNAAQILESAQTGLTNVSEGESKMRTSSYNQAVAFSLVFGSIGGPSGPAMAGAIGRASWFALRGGFGIGKTLLSRATWETALDSVAKWGSNVATTAGLRQIAMSTAKGTREALGAFASGGNKALKQMWDGFKTQGPTAIRLEIGAAGIAADMLTDEDYNFNPDGTINNLLGWGGLCFVYNDTVGTYVMGVNATGAMLGTGINLLSEVIVQSIQDRPLARPDGRRLFAANAISVVTTGFMKARMYGSEHLNTFGLGRELIVPLADKYPRVATFFKAVLRRPGAVKKWVSRSFGVDPTQYAAVAGPNVGAWRGFQSGEGPTFKPMQPIEPADFAKFHPNLPGTWEPPSAATGYRYRLKQPLTQEEFDTLPYKSPRKWEQITTADGKTGYNLKKGDISPDNWLRAMGRNDKWRYNRSDGGFKAQGTFTLDEFKAMNANPVAAKQWNLRKGEDGRWEMFWNKPTLTPSEFDTVSSVLREEGLGKFQPVLTIKGDMANAAGVLPVVLGLNYFLGSKAQNADKEYLALYKGVDYGLAPFIGWQFQVSHGVDTPIAQMGGRLLGLGLVRIPLTFVFPYYNGENQWIGKDKYFTKLENGDMEDAFSVATRTMRSFTPIGVIDHDSGQVEGTCWRLETPALKTLRAVHDEIIGNVAKHQTLANGEYNWQTPNEQKLLHFVSMLNEQIQKVEESEEDSLVRHRLTLVLAAYVKQQIAIKQHDQKEIHLDKEVPRVLQPFMDLIKDHQTFFSRIPVIRSDEKWEEFIRSLNAGSFDN